MAHGTVLLMTLWLFDKADSATSLGCFLLGGILTMVTIVRGSAINTNYIHFSIGAAMLTLVVLLILQSGDSVVGLLGRDITFTGRTELWEQLYRMDKAPWFGSGFDSFFLGDRLKELWSRYWWRPNQAHNGYFEIYLNLGAAGLALFFAMLIWGYTNIVKALKRSPEIGSLKFAYFTAAVLYNITEAGLKVMHPAWIAFLLAVITMPSQKQTKTIPAIRKQ
jgi:O-antigen ligase